MTYEHILFQNDEGIVTITFNRPKAMNALSISLLEEFSSALDEILCDEEIRVLILTGSGEKAFVAGADITELSKLSVLQAKPFIKNGQEIISKLQKLPIPVIAAINGFALGGGLEVALAADFIYASENAKLGLPEISLGLIPGYGGTQRLPRLIGKNLTKELIFTGNMISASDAKEMGFVNKVLPVDQLMDEVRKTAAVIASRGKVSLQAAKQTVNRGLDVDLVSGCNIESDAFTLCIASEDAKEGTSAFLEKRKPAFRGTLNGKYVFVFSANMG